MDRIWNFLLTFPCPCKITPVAHKLGLRSREPRAPIHSSMRTLSDGLQICCGATIGIQNIHEYWIQIRVKLINSFKCDGMLSAPCVHRFYYLFTVIFVCSILRIKWDYDATKVIINCRHRYHRLLVRHFFVCFAAIRETTSASAARNVAHTYLRGQFFLVCVLHWIPTTTPTTANNTELVCNCIIIIMVFALHSCYCHVYESEKTITSKYNQTIITTQAY